MNSRKQLLLRFVLILIGVVCLAVRIKWSYARAAWPFQLDYEEGNILNAGLRILHGQTPYPTPGSFPYTLNCYGPVGYLLTAIGIKLFGLSSFGPRLLILIAVVGIAFLIAAITKTVGNHWFAGLVVALSFICIPLIDPWLPTLRVDCWAVFLSLFGVYLFVRDQRYMALAGFVFGLAILTKHTAVAAPSAVFLELICEKKYRHAVLLAAITSGTVTACVAALGRNFVFSLLQTHPDPYSFVKVILFFIVAVFFTGCIPVLAVIAYAMSRGFSWKENNRLIWFYAAVCILTALTVGKLGSSTNHFLEWISATSILCGLGLSYLIDTVDPLGLAFALGLLFSSVLFTGASQNAWRETVKEQSGCVRAYDFVRNYPSDRILSEDVNAVILSKKTVLVSNPFVITQLGDSVIWQAGSLEQLIQSHYFDLIVMGGDWNETRPEAEGRWSAETLNLIGREYSPIRRFECPSVRVAYEPTSKTLH